MTDHIQARAGKSAPAPLAKVAPAPLATVRGTAPALRMPAEPRQRMRISQATSGLIDEPLSLLVYGVEGIGKTSFAAAAPRPVIIGAENGSAELGHVMRLSPASLDDVVDLLDDLRNEGHGYRTVVIDSLDWLEPLVWAAVCKRGGKSGIEAFGYGKGYVEALADWRALARQLEALRACGLHVILIAHSVCKTWKNPEATQGDFDRYTLKLHEKAGGLWKEWAKAVLFANFERVTVKVDDRSKGIDTGRRLMFTRMSAAYDAKNRLWLPPEIPLGWSPFERAMQAGRAVRERFYQAIAKMDEAGRSAAIEHMEKHDYQPEAAEAVISGLMQ